MGTRWVEQECGGREKRGRTGMWGLGEEGSNRKWGQDSLRNIK